MACFQISSLFFSLLNITSFFFLNIKITCDSDCSSKGVSSEIVSWGCTQTVSLSLSFASISSKDSLVGKIGIGKATWRERKNQSPSYWHIDPFFFFFKYRFLTFNPTYPKCWFRFGLIYRFRYLWSALTLFWQHWHNQFSGRTLRSCYSKLNYPTVHFFGSLWRYNVCLFSIQICCSRIDSFNV